MIDLEVIGNNINLKVYVDKIKYLIIDDYLIRDLIINVISSFFNKEKQSEYSYEKEYTSILKTDGEMLRISDYNYFFINEYFDVFNDIKLGSKSLCLKYLESLLDGIEYNDTFQTFKILYDDLCEYINSMINTDKSEMSLRLDTNLELKQLFKIFNFKLFKDDLQINSLDLDYNEKILFQLKMINVICKRENKQNLVLIAIPFITETILDYISTIDNAKVLVFPNKVAKNVKIDSKNVFYFSVDCAVDLYDDNTIYDLCLSANKNYSINEYKNKLMEEVMKIII